MTCISTHAPREGSDGGILDAYTELDVISTHAPREGSDKKRCNTC